MNITANNNFAVKAVATITATFTAMYIIMNYFMLGVDLQVIKSSEYDYFFINKFEKKNNVGDYIAYKAKPLPPYFEEGSIFIKKIAAIPGDVITVKDGYQKINNGEPRYLHLYKTLNKEINDFDRTETVSNDALWVMGTTKFSYDSRYTGEILDSQIVGRAYPLW